MDYRTRKNDYAQELTRRGDIESYVSKKREKRFANTKDGVDESIKELGEYIKKNKERSALKRKKKD